MHQSAAHLSFMKHLTCNYELPLLVWRCSRVLAQHYRIEASDDADDRSAFDDILFRLCEDQLRLLSCISDSASALVREPWSC